MESLMERQSREKAFSSLFSAAGKQKNQQPHFYKLLIFRAENGTRTRDLNLGKVALYQLSYFRKLYPRTRSRAISTPGIVVSCVSGLQI